MTYSYAEYVPVLKALSDETRLRIIDILACGEQCACDVLEKLEITQPTLSHHMKTLTESGLVTGVKDGSWVRYTINDDRYAEIIRFLNKVGEKSVCCS